MTKLGKMNFKPLIHLFVVLIAAGCGDDEVENNLPIASFTFNPITRNEVSFSNNSTNAISYNWDFGDNSTSTEINPSHTYLESGQFTVILEAINDSGSDYHEVEVEIEPGEIQVSTFAEINDPIALSSDDMGNIYVVNDYSIFKITKNGVISRVESTGLRNLNGIHLDNSGNIYVTERSVNRISKITSDLQIMHIAGGTQGNKDGFGNEAQFSEPMGIVVDDFNNIYVTDRLNDLIRKITQEGEVTTIAGSTNGRTDGAGLDAKFNNPVGISIGPDGSMFIGDANNAVIRKITPEGIVSTYAGSYWGFQDGANGLFKNPLGLEVDSLGNVYVADNSNHKIRKISTDGIASTIAGSDKGFKDGPAMEAQFDVPFDIALDNSGNIYVADLNNNRIRVITVE